MWYEEDYDIVGAFEEHNQECESDDDLTDLDLDSEMADDTVEEEFDEED